MDGELSKALEWLLGSDTGASSKAMLAHFMAIRPNNGGRLTAAPLDSADFGRCLRLLLRFPQWRGRLHELRNLSPEWAAYVDHWAELEALYDRENSPGETSVCSARMYKIWLSVL